MTTIAPGSIDTGADWTPRMPAQTVAPGAIVTLTATWTIPSGPVGTWKALMSVKVNNVWTDGPTTTFTVSTTPPQVPPAAPTNLRAVKINDTRLEISWDSSLLASHELERNEQNAGFKLRAALAPGNLHYSDSIRRRRDYQYRIRARNASGVSPYSSVISYNGAP